MAQLEKTGVSLIVENAQKSIRDLNAFNDARQKLDKGLDSSVKSRALGEVSKQLSDIGKNAMSGIPGLGKFASSLGEIGAVSGTTIMALGGVTVAVTAAAAGIAAFFSLGKRGAEMQATLNAFGNIASGVQTSTQVLENLRVQTRGTISDMELMRLTVLSLQGTSKGFRDVVAPNIGTIIDVTNRVAQATGQSAEVVREKFFLGLRRQSKLLLDDVGVVVDKTSAEFKKLAAEIGDEAAYSQLAIDDLIRVGKELGAINVVQEAMIKPMILFRNTLDQLALAVQPAFAPIATAIGSVTDKLRVLITTVMPFVQAGFKVIGAVISGVFTVISAVYEATLAPIMSRLMVGLTYAAAAADLLADAFSYVANVIAGAIASAIGWLSSSLSGVFDFISSARDRLFGETDMTITGMATKLAAGGGRIIGSLAAGMARGATAVVNVVTKIAQIVADFLQGFSPPKKGPLAQIDTGGANVIRAWSDGLLKGFTNPAEEVAAEVNKRLGNIASMSLSQIDARLRQLDIAVQPFVEQLDIAKADFEAITGFADPAIQSLERLQQRALKAGDLEGALAFDRQLTQLKEMKGLEQERVDQAQVQLTLAQARQAQERALLEIQKRRLGGGAAEAGEGGGAGEPTEKAPDGAPKRGGGGGELPTGGGGGITGGGDGPALIGGPKFEQAKKDIINFGKSVGNGFADGFSDATADAFADFDVARGGLDQQLARIQSSNPVKKLTDKFSGLSDIFTQPFSEIETQFNEFFGTDGKLATALEPIKTKFDDLKTEIQNKIGGAFDGLNVASAGQRIKNFVSSALTDAGARLPGINVLSFKTNISALLDTAFDMPGDMAARVSNRIKGVAESALTLVAPQLGGLSVAGIKERLASLVTRAFELRPDIADTLGNRVKERVSSGLDSAKGLIDGLVSGETFTAAKEAVSNVVNGILDLSGLKDISIDDLVAPIENFINKINEILGKLDLGLVDAAKAALSTVGGLVGLGGDEKKEDTDGSRFADALNQATQQAMAVQVTLPEGVSLPEETIAKLREAGASMMTYITEGLTGAGSALNTALTTAITPLVTEDGIFGPEGLLLTTLRGIFGEEGQFSLMLTSATLSFTTFSDTLTTQLDTLAAKFRSVFIDAGSPVQSITTTLSDITTQALAIFTAFAGEEGMGTALGTFADSLHNSMVNPTVAALNGMLQAVEESLNAAIDAVNLITGQFGRIFPKVSVGRVSPITAAAAGGVGLKGMTLVGEEGPELVSFKRPANVFPAAVTRAFTQMLAQPQPMFIPGGTTNNTYNNQRSISNNINVNSPQDGLLMMRQLEASYS